MTEHADSLRLAWLADRFRAQATLGLHYRPDQFDRERFTRLRRHAAELASLIYPQDVDVIEESFRTDSGIHTPNAAVALYIECADGARLWRAFLLEPGRLLPDEINAAAARIAATEPGQPVALTDSRVLGLPDPHTYLAIYRTTSSLTRADLREVWPTPDTAIQRPLTGIAPASIPALPRQIDERPVIVSPVVAAICRDIAEIAEEGGLETADPYNVERFEHLGELAANISPESIGYQRFGPFELHPSAAATGAEIAIRDEAGRVLLIQRSDTGQWAIPGGACEVGEDWAATAVREAREEIGLSLDPSDLALVDVFDNRAITSEPTTIPVIAVFSMVLKPNGSTITRNREVDNTAWATLSDLKDLDLFRGHRTKITAALEQAD
ncbi:NUDIX hydrolase N-terminal domain-containing protein [Glycomyces artemisiae]|uniref:ADP-ribose pyrophosphatase YjhB (NUDIX family) n=1 Tax=Glycomyces artemisiae TaxID=1076443 RepID=A0A2T0UUU3_9ACTN|nr:NUDIX hydrolase N-terminal domain-containing protein [Glycomyces artemisiae]PRY61680.1 ADP-ribose pyrophosphatase YjhB (NUDIX family) [Glycomyces artemisiae]